MKTSVEPLSLESYLDQDESFSSAYFRVLCAIASSEGLPSLAEYSAIYEIADSADESAVATVFILSGLERPRAITESLMQLKKASEGVNSKLRKETFDAAAPLLRLYGYKSRDLAKKLAKSLACDLKEVEINSFLSEEDKPWLKIIKRTSVRLMRGNQLRDLAKLSFSVTRDVKDVQCVVDYEDGLVTIDQLRAQLNSQCEDINHQTQSLESQMKLIEFGKTATTAYLQTAQALKNQIDKKLAAIEARIDFERSTFEEEIDSNVYDAGNAIELEIAERLKTDQWKNPQVWESIQTTIAKELESRLERLTRQRERTLQLINDDLRLFQEEMKFTRISILSRQHHTRLSNQISGMRVRTRVTNGLNSTADVTLGIAGVAAVAGTGTYFLGAAVSLPAIVATAPFIVVPIAIAAVIKCLSSARIRKDKEISHKRNEFEKILREQLMLAQKSFNSQLDDLAKGFRETALKVTQQRMLEAEAADKLIDLQIKMTKRLVEESRRKVLMLSAAIPAG